VNVVRCGIAVNDFDGLSGHHADNVGRIFASPLRQGNRTFWNIEPAIAESLLYIDEDVLEVSSANHDVLGGVRPLAVGILAHVNFGRFRLGAFEFYGSAYASGGGGINWRGCRSRRRARSRWLFVGSFLLAATAQQSDSEKDRQAPHR
jgi:hypothetical protein